MEDIESIIEFEGTEKLRKTIDTKQKPKLKNGTIVYCKGTGTAQSFIGIVYDNTKVLELPYGSNAYINSDNYIHLGDTVNYWIIEKVLKTKLIIEDIIAEI